MTNQNKLILIVEGNPGDLRLFREALVEIGSRHEIVVAKDGDDALERLCPTSSAVPALAPDILFLALNLPKKGAQRVLEKVKNDSDLRAIPVVVFYNSAAPAEIAEAYRLRADSCVYRPDEFDQLCQLLSDIDHRWLSDGAPAAGSRGSPQSETLGASAEPQPISPRPEVPT